MVRRKVGVYVKSWGAALIRDAATNREFTVDMCHMYVSVTSWKYYSLYQHLHSSHMVFHLCEEFLPVKLLWLCLQ